MPSWIPCNFQPSTGLPKWVPPSPSACDAPWRDGASDLCGSSTVGQKKKTEGLSENGVYHGTPSKWPFWKIWENDD